MKDLLPATGPRGLTLIPGGQRDLHLPHRPLPDVALANAAHAEILALLNFAGVSYASPDCPAARAGVQIFASARDLIRAGRFDAVTFDWDHTFSNYLVFEDLATLVRARRGRQSPSAYAAPMVAVEVTRPFMIELAFGMMVGFALRQGLRRFSQWSAYRPKVGVASLTWPDRLARLAAHYLPILPLMEAIVPGTPSTYEHFMSPDVRSVLNLHHFLDYAQGLMERVGAGALLTVAEGHEALGYAEDLKAHKRKPLGAWIGRGWDASRLLHIDDSTTIVADLTHQAALRGLAEARFLRVPHPHSRIFRNVREWHKVWLPGFWRARPAAMAGAIETLARQEWGRSNVPAILTALGIEFPRSHWPGASLPEGTVLPIHETPTTVGDFWTYYLEPTQRARALIQDVTGKDLSRLRRRFRHTRAA